MYIKVICIFFLFHYSQSALLDLSCHDISNFVKLHNVVRLLLAKGEEKDQPPASEMNSIVWDEELAAKAAKWASKYPKSHNPDQTIPSGRFLTSQSMSSFSVMDTKFNIDPKYQMVLWYTQVSNYTYGPFTKNIIDPSQAHIGHYTQMVWSDSIYLGCALSENIEDTFKYYHLVCEYGPSGNIIGEVPYKAGPPCNVLKCAADEDHCKYPYGEKCPDEV